MKTNSITLQLTQLSEVLTARTEKPAVEDILSGKIKIVSKITFSDGQIHLRNESKTKTGMILIKPDDLVISGINACKGAIAIYNENMKEDISATIHYSSYIPKKEKIEIKFLWLLLRSEVFKDILNKYLPGGIKTELKPSRFLKIPVPLPPLAEQQRIVKKIEKLTSKIEEAKRLREKAIEESEAVIDSELQKIFNNKKFCKTLSDVIGKDLELNKECRNPSATNPNDDFLYLDISNVESNTGKIMEVKTIKGYDAPSRARRVIRTNDVLFSTVRPYLKSFTIVPPSLDNQICSTGFAVFTCSSKVNPKFLWYQLLSPFFLKQCKEKMRGAHYPAINETNLKKLKLVIPNILEQNTIVKYLENIQNKINCLKQAQTETQTMISVLIPSILSKAFKGELL